MLRIIVACLILNINPILAISKTDSHGNKVPTYSNVTHDKSATTYNFNSTNHSLSGKEKKVIIQLLTEKPLSKTYKKELDTKKLSLGIPEIHKPSAEKAVKEWSAFRRWKEDAKGKPPEKNRQPRTFTAQKLVTELALQSLTSVNPAVIKPYDIIEDTIMNNSLPGNAIIAKQQANLKLESGKLSLGKTSTQKPTVEWAALRRLKEKVDENPVTIKSIRDRTAFSYWQRNIAKTVYTTRKRELKHVVDEQPATEIIEKESHSILGKEKTVATNLYKKSTTKKIAAEKSSTKKPVLYNFKYNLIKRRFNPTKLTRYRVTKKKILQNTSQRTLQTIKSTTERSRKCIQGIPSWKAVEKWLQEKRARNKSISKKAASIKRAAPQNPPSLCWDGRGVQQVSTRTPEASKIVEMKRSEHGKVVYRKINNKKTPGWSMRVKPNRKATYKKVANRKSHHNKGKNSPKKIGPKRVTKKAKRKKGKIVMPRNRKESKINTKRKKS